MKKIMRFLICILLFPVDLVRLTVDAWRFTIEGYTPRFRLQNPDQACIYCRGCDHGTVPRPMHNQIKYWNFWILRVLHPNLVLKEAKNRVRKIPYCKNEGGYIYTQGYIPIIAIILSIFWAGSLLGLLEIFDMSLRPQGNMIK